ncbi:MAG: ester cyclase [Blastocatellia bacterium]
MPRARHGPAIESTEGLLAGVAPTGKSVRVQHIHMFRLKDGWVVEHWANRDDIEMARQLGLWPSPAAASAPHTSTAPFLPRLASS